MDKYYLAFIYMIVSGSTIMQGADIIEKGDMSVRLQDKLNQAAWEAVLSCQTERVDAMLLGGADVNFSNVDGTSLLMCACMNADHRTAQLLLNNGADVYKRDNEKRTALMYAASSTDCKTIKMLLSKGASVWDIDAKHQTSFVYAIKACRDQSLKHLLDKARDDRSVPSYIEDKDMDQLLLSAVQSKHCGIVKALLEYGIDASGKALNHQCPLVTAFKTHQADICRLLILYKADISCLGPHKRYSFH